MCFQFLYPSITGSVMVGRQILSEDDDIDPDYDPHHPDMVRRRTVLRETLNRFSTAEPPNRYERLAQANLERWRVSCEQHPCCNRVYVVGGDWGDVTQAMTMRYGCCFAALNMANAFVPGGAYVEGAAAQEENLFRRTNCHFFVGPEEYDSARDRYHPHMTSLLSAENGKVYLDAKNPRICIRGPEDRTRVDLGYQWLPDEDVFPFFELRAAAQDLRDGSTFSESNARKRIAAQLDTLMSQNVKHAVLGASGCGAFMNPADRIAELYRQEIEQRKQGFRVIAFAIYQAGYGPDNLTPFQNVFDDPLTLG